MIEVGDLLSKFENLLFSKRVQKSIIQESIKEVVRIEIPLDDIEIKGVNAHINTKPIYRSEIFLNKDKILNTINSKSIKNKIKNLI